MNLQDFVHGIGERLSFGPRVCKEDLRISMKRLQKQIADMDSFGKDTQIQKTNQSNPSSDEGDIIDLKSTFFLENSMTMGQRKIQ